jgi:signal-transduction protein with cAMP-binding, CBS, and nucleotidyltransferase domain
MVLSVKPVSVEDFMSKNVATMYSHSTVTHAIKAMVDRNIGSLVVIDDEGPIGIFSERDLLGNVLGRGRRPEECIVMEVMTRTFDAIKPDATLIDSAKEMTLKKGRLMVFSDGDIIGIVTASDIVREIFKAHLAFDISDVLSKKVVSVDPKTAVGLAVQHMNEKRIGSVLVKGTGGEPVGIFTERDMLNRVLAPNLSLASPIGDVATIPLRTAQVGIDGIEAARIMTSYKIKRLPLMEDQSIIGIVTARDLVEAFSNLG